MKTKKLFSPTFEPSMQPGHTTRYKSLDGLIGQGIPECIEPEVNVFKERENLKEKFKSNQVKQLLPSVILRKKGVL